MRAVVTGAAGFIGSHLTEALLEGGWDVVAVDCFTPYYDAAVKQANAARFRDHPRCRFVTADLRLLDAAALMAPGDTVFHQAGQPGVRRSWGESFRAYVDGNVGVTQRLLEGARAVGVRRFVYASSSSVYGEAVRFPCAEGDLPRPVSPYGVTKLAAEHLCTLYADEAAVPTVSLRYFTVYGPRQRPDMALHRLARAALTGEPFPLYGDGRQVRDFTYVADVVRAALLAGTTPGLGAGTVVNVAGGSAVTLAAAVERAEAITGRPVTVARSPGRVGDVRRTGGATERAAALLGWRPQVPLAQGLAAEIAWMEELLTAGLAR